MDDFTETKEENLETFHEDDECDISLADRIKCDEKTDITEKPKAKKLKTDSEEHSESQTKLEDNPEQVKEKLEQGCECQVSCFRDLEPESVYKHRLNIAELTKAEHEMYLMGVTMASLANRNETSRHKERIRQRASYVYQGRKVCLYAFCYLENVTNYQLKRIRSHVLTNGVVPRTHGNTGRKPHNTFTLDLYKRVETFMKEYLNLPQTNKNIVIQGESKSKVYKAYKNFEMKDNSEKIMGYSTFRHFMKKQFPNVKFVPKNDGKPNEQKRDVIKNECTESSANQANQYFEEYLDESEGEYQVIIDNSNVDMITTIDENGEMILSAIEEDNFEFCDAVNE